MLSMNHSEEEIIEKIGSLGWIRVTDTGKNSSNCLLNDLGIAIHHKKHGFHPYIFEISEKIRDDLISRDEALKKVESIPDIKACYPQMKQLGLNMSQF